MKFVQQSYGNAGIRKLVTRKRVNWTPAEIINGIRLYSTSSKAYRQRLASNEPLPAVRTLQTWMKKCEIQPGFLKPVFEIMKQKSYEDKDKVCVLMADEMKVREVYHYNRATDTLLEPTKYIQTLYVRGLRVNWQQPIYAGYDTKLSKDLINDAIERLQQIGYHVVAFVTDLHPSNVKCMRNMKVTAEHPYFCLPSNKAHKVFVFADTPHLIKSLRNNFIRRGMTIDNKKLFITKEPLVQLLNLKSGHTLRITYKLTREMLFTTSLTAQKVKYATKLFSQTNATALNRAGQLGKIANKNWEKLSSIIDLINKWFDVFNAKTLRIDSRPRMAAYGLQLEVQDKILRRMSKFMLNMSIGDKVKTNFHPFQTGIISNIKALQMLYKHLKQNFGFDFIITSRINQDPLEHFFSRIRAKGSSNHPTATEFMHRCKQYVLGRGGYLPTTANVSAPTENVLDMDIEPTFAEGSVEKRANQPESFNFDLKDNYDQMGMDAIEHVAGVALNKLIKQGKNMTDFTETDPEKLKGDTWTQMLSEGGFTIPNDKFVMLFKGLDMIFNDFNNGSFNYGTSYMTRLIALAKDIDLDYQTKHLFFRHKTEFRIRAMNGLLVKKVHDSKLRKLIT